MPGQTLSQIRSLLASAGLSPQHRFGQNFLIDLNLMRKALAAAEVHPADVVLEIGPGTGSLTEMLLDTGCRVIAVEIDRGLQELLRSRLGANARFHLIGDDALAGKHELNRALVEALRDAVPEASGARKLVANLPYQIATPLLMELLAFDPLLANLTSTIQKEVGERLLAQPHTGAYGPASVITQTLARVTRIATLPPSAFWPAPKVESVMLRIEPLPHAERPLSDVAAFSALVHRAFTLRRKKVHHGLRAAGVENPLELLESVEISRDVRPEALTPCDWQRLHRRIAATRAR